MSQCESIICHSHLHCCKRAVHTSLATRCVIAKAAEVRRRRTTTAHEGQRTTAAYECANDTTVIQVWALPARLVASGFERGLLGGQSTSATKSLCTQSASAHIDVINSKSQWSLTAKTIYR